MLTFIALICHFFHKFFFEKLEEKSNSANLFNFGAFGAENLGCYGLKMADYVNWDPPKRRSPNIAIAVGT